MTNYNLEEFKQWLVEHESWKQSNSRNSWKVHFFTLEQNWKKALWGKAAFNPQDSESRSLITPEQQALVLQWKNQVDQRERERESKGRRNQITW